MKKFLVLLALLVFQQGFAQVSPHPYHGTISTAGSDCSVATRCVTVTIPPETASATIAVDATTGSWSGTIQFEGSVDGTIWIAMVPTSNSSSTSSSTTSTGVWQFNPSSYIKIRARASARASGTAPILINWSNATASNGSSAGGGTPGGSNTQAQFNDSGAFAGATNFLINKTTGQITINQKADTNETIYGTRATDTTPTGNFIHFVNVATADLFKVDVLGNVLAAGSIGSGTAPAGVASTATGGFACTEATNTGWTPTSATDYVRCDSTLHRLVGSNNGDTESAIARAIDSQNQKFSYLADSGAADAYVITLAPAVVAYAAGQRFSFKASAANATTTPTLNVSGLGAKTITKNGGSALAANDIKLGQIVDVEYDGTAFQMQSTLGNAASGGGSFYVTGSCAGTFLNNLTNTANTPLLGLGGNSSVGTCANAGIQTIGTPLPTGKTITAISCVFTTVTSTTSADKITLLDNGVATAITGQITTASSSGTNRYTGSVATTAGHYYAIGIGTSASSQLTNASCTVEGS